MKRNFLVAAAAVLALGFTATVASAQCAFERPKKAKKMQGEFVQAFVSCGNPGGNTPNTTTEGGIPACGPPETFNEQDGSPPAGWLWGPKSTSKFQFQSSKNKVVNPMNPPADSSDVKVQLQLKGIIDLAGDAEGPGTLATLTRATLDDRTNGDITVVDFGANFPFDLIAGKAKLKTTANTFLNAGGIAGLPACASLELVSVGIVDENSNAFGTAGILNNINKVPSIHP